MLEIEGLRKGFNGVAVLSDISCRFHGGRVYALCGLNGSGKSTFIKIVSGILRADAGDIRLNGRTITPATPRAVKAAGVHVIYQDLALFPNLSVAENITIGSSADHPFALRRRWRDRAKARAVLDRIRIDIAPGVAVEDLSIAERQVVAIARALSGDTRLLILDEPTASLTKKEVERLFAVIRDLKRDGVTILFVSHRYEEVATIADEALVLRDGRLVAHFDQAGLSADKLHEAMTGTPPPPPARIPVTSSDGEVALETRNLTRRGEFSSVSLTIRRGGIVGLTGLLGAGRTEFAQTIFGLRSPDSGEIRIAGRARRFASNRDAIEAGVAYLPEDRLALGLVLESSVADNIALSSRGRLANWAGVVDRAATDELVAAMVEDLGIKAANVGDPVSTLSGGNQQRVVLAKWLATAPSLLLLDSPTVGVDVSARAAIYRLIQEAASRGVGILLISDEIEEVWAHAQQVYVMKGGVLSVPYAPQSISLQALTEIVHG